MRFVSIAILAAMVAPCVFAGVTRGPSLKQAFKDSFIIGAALNSGQFREKGKSTLNLVAQQFSTISPENAMKWSSFNPKPGVYNHDTTDAFVSFGQQNRMYVFAHVLFWHSQTPDWVFKDNRGGAITRDALLKRMRERVRHVATRYGRKIHGWDVVNETFMDNGKLRDSQWTRIIGSDFVEQAFRIAEQELPRETDLLYNDYSMTGKRKRDAVVRMVRELKEKKVRIDGVGMQAHWSISHPSIKQIESSILAYSKAGVGVHITELDIDVLPRKAGMWGADVSKRLASDPSMNPYTDGLPDDMQKKLAKRYEDIFRLFLKHKDKIKRVTFWGVTDKYTWLNNWPIRGRTSHPLLFDRAGKPKAAYHAVINLTIGR